MEQHKDIFARSIKYAIRNTFAKTHLYMKGYFCMRVEKKLIKYKEKENNNKINTKYTKIHENTK